MSPDTQLRTQIAEKSMKTRAFGNLESYTFIMSGFRLSCPNLHIFSSKSLKDKKHAVISSAGSNFTLLAQQKTVISLCDTQVHLPFE